MANDVIIEFNDIPRVLKKNPDLFDGAVDSFAEDGVRFVRQIMKDSPATGNVYFIEGVSHTSSSPGNPPRPESSALINSLNVQPAGKGQRIIADGVDYGIMLEFGTSKMEARPFFGPMIAKLKKDAPQYFKDVGKGIAK